MSISHSPPKPAGACTWSTRDGHSRQGGRHPGMRRALPASEQVSAKRLLHVKLTHPTAGHFNGNDFAPGQSQREQPDGAEGTMNPACPEKGSKP